MLFRSRVAAFTGRHLDLTRRQLWYMNNFQEYGLWTWIWKNMKVLGEDENHFDSYLTGKAVMDLILGHG